MPPRSWLMIAWVAVSACAEEPDEGDSGPMDDGGIDGGADAEAPFEPAPPEPPALPVMTPCPAGWREARDDATVSGLVRCDPWPEGGHVECPVGEAHFPGTPGCEVVGTPCSPDSPFATDLPADAEVIYVEAGRAGGSGLENNPFGDLQHAIDVANARGGAIVALSKGTFDGAFTIYEPVTLWGACTAETVLTRTDVAPNASVIEINDRGPVTIRNLRIDAEQAGIYAWEAVDPITVESVVIRGRYAGVYIDSGSTADFSNLVVMDSMPAEDERAGQGLVAAGGSHVSITRGLFMRTHLAAISVIDEESVLTVRDCAILDTDVERASGFGGAGLQARVGAHATIERVVVDGSHSGGVAALDEGTAVDVSDLVVRNVAAAQGYGGHGLVAADGGRVTGRRIDVALTHQIGVTIIDDALAEIDDLVIVDTAEAGLSSEFTDGVGLGVGFGSIATVRRALIARNIEMGVQLHSEGARLDAEDFTILDTAPGSQTNGYGIAVDRGSEASFTRVHVARSSGGSISVFGDLALTDAVVEDTLPAGFYEFEGWALGAANGGEVTLERVVLRNHTSMGLVAFQGASLVGRDVQILDVGTLESAAAAVASAVISGGEGSAVELTSFRVAGAGEVGLQLSVGATIDLRQGEVRDNPIGVNVQDPEFDLTRIQDDVRYFDNGVNLDTSDLPLPALELPGET